MSEQVNSESNEQKLASSGLLLSVEHLAENRRYTATHTDDTDTDSGEEGDIYRGDENDASDDQEDATDADGSDDSDDSDD